MLRIYADKSFLTQGNRSHVFPLLFDLFYGNSELLSRYYNISDSIEDSDIMILCLEYGYMQKKFKKYVSMFFNKAKKHKKPIWIYSGGDYGYTLADDHVYNFRLGGFKSKLNKRTIILPSFISDPYEEHLKNSFNTLKKEEVPKIGFVGHANGKISKYIKELINYAASSLKYIFKQEFIDYQSFYPSSSKRANYLRKFEKNKRILADFIIRDQYRAGVKTEDEKIKTTKEFYQNIFDCPYTFCMRGNGNFSVRFYETLAVGRIPFFLDTDCKLPLEGIINWKNHIVLADQKNIKDLDDQLLKFHESISGKDFEQIQINNRKLWKDYLTREAFFKHIHDKFVINS